EANPTRAGQYVHLYMTGLGAVSPPVRTGQPAPSSPLAELAALVAPRDRHGRGAPVDGRRIGAAVAHGSTGAGQPPAAERNRVRAGVRRASRVRCVRCRRVSRTRRASPRVCGSGRIPTVPPGSVR
ncbi:MAG: hypothetical protein FJW39_25830, partial [Acidobacteria bacterium]|nr:hypothetical protein [Acidobacteriota bacterium]